MITVEIPKKDLLRQLPQQAGYALLQWFDEMPHVFQFEALPCQTKSQRLEIDYPAIKKVLTPIEWILFVALYERGKVRYSTLYALFTPEDKGLDIKAKSNGVQVHAKNFRAKLKKMSASFQLITYRQSIGGEGAFQLLKI